MINDIVILGVVLATVFTGFALLYTHGYFKYLGIFDMFTNTEDPPNGGSASEENPPNEDFVPEEETPYKPRNVDHVLETVLSTTIIEDLKFGVYIVRGGFSEQSRLSTLIQKTPDARKYLRGEISKDEMIDSLNSWGGVTGTAGIPYSVKHMGTHRTVEFLTDIRERFLKAYESQNNE